MQRASAILPSMPNLQAPSGAIDIRLTKSDPALAFDRAQISRVRGAALDIELRRAGDELAILFSRFAVENYCGFKGILFQLGHGAELADGPSHSPTACETLKSEIVVKTLLDARADRRRSAEAVRDTAELLLRELQPRAARESRNDSSETLSTATVSRCLLFIERSLRAWEALPEGKTLVLADWLEGA